MAERQANADGPACQTGANWAVVSTWPSLTPIESRKGPWHMVKTIALGVGMTNARLQAKGVLSLKIFWAELAQLRLIAVCGPKYTVVLGDARKRATLPYLCDFKSLFGQATKKFSGRTSKLPVAIVTQVL